MQPTMTTDNHGNIQYTLYGLRHREDGPAIIYADGEQCWYLNGLRHREDGPAVIRADGTQSWYINDRLHRLDGPAFTYADGTHLWYINGKIYDFDDYCKQLKLSEEVIVFLKLKYNTND
jgi:hypothetical protein